MKEEEIALLKRYKRMWKRAMRIVKEDGFIDGKEIDIILEDEK